MRQRGQIGMFTNKRGTSPASSQQLYYNKPYMFSLEDVDRSVGRSDYDFPQAGMIRKKKPSRETTSCDLLALEKENIRLRTQLMEKQLSERQYIQRILELEHEVINISNRLSEMQMAATERNKLERARSQNIKPNVSLLEGLSLIQPQTTSAKKDITVSLATASSYDDLRQYNRIAELVTKKVGLRDTKEIYDYVKTCVKFTETVKQSILEISPIYQSNCNRLVKGVWKKLKVIIAEWIDHDPPRRRKEGYISPGEYLHTSYV